MTVYNEVAANKRKSLLIIILFIIFVTTVGYVLGKALGYGLTFTGVVLIISGLASFFSYYYSDKIVLSISGAKPVDENKNKRLYHIVENLTIASGLPLPKIYEINDPAPNAFATGRDPQHSAIAVTSGLLEKLKDIELEGVIAHELSHVKNFDTRVMGIVSILVGSVAILADFFLRSAIWGGISRDNEDRKGNIFLLIAIIFAILSPIIATLIQLAISRRREYLADADAALLTRYPDGLANALEKIATDQHVLKNASTATAHFYIEDPLKKEKKTSWLVNLFNTHPPIEDRIRILREM